MVPVSRRWTIRASFASAGVESPSLRSLSTRHENIDEGKHTVNDAPIDPIQDAIHETLFTLQQPQGFYAFLIPAFILTMAVYSVALFPAFVCQTGYLKYTLGHFPDRSLATSLCMIGLDATGLALLLTCRTTVANLRRGSVQRETQRRDIQKGLLPRPDRGYRRQLQIMGGSDGLDHGSWLSKIAPCIDWSLLRAGSWGRAYLEIIIPWAGFVALHFGVFISLADIAPVISEVASAVIQFAIEVLLVWIALEQYREKSWPQKLKSAMIISVSLCTLSQIAYYSSAGIVYMFLSISNYFIRSITSHAIFNIISLWFCFSLPEIPRLRLILMRSLAPSSSKVAAILLPQVVAGYPMTHVPNERRSANPRIYEGRRESVEEIDFAATALASYGMCVRFVLSAIPSTILFLRVDSLSFFIAGITSLVFQWFATGFFLVITRMSISSPGLSKEEWFASACGLELAVPIPDFESMRGGNETFETIRNSRSLVNLQKYPQHSNTSSMVPGCKVSETYNPPFTPWTRLRLLAVSHYVSCVAHSSGTAFAGCLTILFLVLSPGTINQGLRASLGDDPSVAVGQGIAAAAFPTPAFQGTILWFMMIFLDVGANAVIASWMARWGGVCYGDVGGVLGFGRGKTWSRTWDPRRYVGSATDVLFGICASFFVAGAIARGIAGVRL